LLGPRPERQEAQSNLRAVYRPGVRTHGLDQATDFDVRCYLPGDILVKVDRAAMAHGLETRAPFLDMDLVNFVLGLGWSTRFTGEASKPLLRTAFAGRWPESVQRRAKQGFGAPIWEWVKRPDVQSLLQRVCARGSPLVALLPDVGSLSASCDLQQMWSILCLGLWLEKRQECL
jgi:asparagine synthase (glutamine-hydrolysing)